ncbi:MAG TPA: DUF5985 family protein [Steroidobacteraceae bacterium]|jgi:hypothetical protein|nr:DUF5985 family protein [Steroidobacteraceae bacterium]
MKYELMKYYVWGTLAMSCLVAALFFLHHWRVTRDRLFLFFAAAFGLMALQWTASSLAGTNEQNHSYLLLLRLFAFLSIIAAIIDKNRRDHRP